MGNYISKFHVGWEKIRKNDREGERALSGDGDRCRPNVETSCWDDETRREIMASCMAVQFPGGFPYSCRIPKMVCSEWIINKQVKRHGWSQFRETSIMSMFSKQMKLRENHVEHPYKRRSHFWNWSTLGPADMLLHLQINFAAALQPTTKNMKMSHFGAQ